MHLFRTHNLPVVIVMLYTKAMHLVMYGWLIYVNR